MNIQAFNSSELDLIYDLIFERLGCTDSDKESRDCNTIISKLIVKYCQWCGLFFTFSPV